MALMLMMSVTTSAFVPKGLKAPLKRIGVSWSKATDWTTIQEQYVNNQAVWDEVLEWLTRRELFTLEPGTYYIGADSIRVKIQDANTREESRIEAHIRYIDLQWTIRGNERYEIYDPRILESTDRYDARKDVQHFRVKDGVQLTKRNHRVILSNPNTLQVFFSDQPHKALLIADTTTGAEPIRKIVVKIPCINGDLQIHEKQMEMQKEYGDVMLK